MSIRSQAARKVTSLSPERLTFVKREAGRLRGPLSQQPCPAHDMKIKSKDAHAGSQKSDRNERIFPKRLAKFGIVR
jgi:hypothetical protein